MKKRILLFVAILFCFAFAACTGATPFYSLSDLEGQWQRISSTDSHSDSLIVTVRGDSAVIDYVPTGSYFSIGQKKWVSLLPVVNDGHFELYDLSKNGTSSRAIITIHTPTKLQIKNKDFPSAPGADQTWVKI